MTNFAVFHHMLQHLYVRKGVREKIDDRGDAIAYEINLTMIDDPYCSVPTHVTGPGKGKFM